MMRALLFAGALLCLGTTQPIESALHVAAAAATSAQASETGGGGLSMPEETLIKYAMTQGGLTIVCLVLFWWIQREHKRQDAFKDDRQQILIALVEKNIAALSNSEATNARLSRAIESTRLLPPGAGV